MSAGITPMHFVAPVNARRTVCGRPADTSALALVYNDRAAWRACVETVRVCKHCARFVERTALFATLAAERTRQRTP